MALAYTSSNAVPTSTKAFMSKGPLIQQSIDYGQQGSVAESPSGFNAAKLIRETPFGTGMVVVPTGQYAYNNETNNKGPFFKMLLVNPVSNKQTVWAGINAPATGQTYMSTGIGIPISGGSSYEFGGLGAAPVRNLWVMTQPGQTGNVSVYGQFSNAEAI